MYTWQEIKKEFKDEWVAMDQWEEDEHGDVVKGEVAYHTKDGRKAFYSYLKDHFPKKNLAIRYTGNVRGPFFLFR